MAELKSPTTIDGNEIADFIVERIETTIDSRKVKTVKYASGLQISKVYFESVAVQLSANGGPTGTTYAFYDYKELGFITFFNYEATTTTIYCSTSSNIILYPVPDYQATGLNVGACPTRMRGYNPSSSTVNATISFVVEIHGTWK